jgi:TonB family protein
MKDEMKPTLAPRAACLLAKAFRVADLGFDKMLTNRTLLFAVLVSLSLLSIAASPSAPNRSPVPNAELVLYAPPPEYPEGARQARIAGSGWFRLDFTKTGRVTQVRVTKSTGSKILDAAVLQTLWHWRFKPGLKVHCASLPITFRP